MGVSSGRILKANFGPSGTVMVSIQPCLQYGTLIGFNSVPVDGGIHCGIDLAIRYNYRRLNVMTDETLLMIIVEYQGANIVNS